MKVTGREHRSSSLDRSKAKHKRELVRIILSKRISNYRGQFKNRAQDNIQMRDRHKNQERVQEAIRNSLTNRKSKVPVLSLNNCNPENSNSSGNLRKKRQSLLSQSLGNIPCQSLRNFPSQSIMTTTSQRQPSMTCAQSKSLIRDKQLSTKTTLNSNIQN